MKYKHSLIFAAAILMWGGTAFADTDTLDKGETIYDDGYTLSGPQGSATLSFSKRLVTAMNIPFVQLAPVPAATTAVATSTNVGGAVRYVSVQANAPVTSLQYDLSSDVLNPLVVHTQGGVLLSTSKNSGTYGAGSLSITDLKVDLVSKTIYADIDGANGVGFKDDYALWTFDAITGSTSFDLTQKSLWSQALGSGTPTVNMLATSTLSGLFLVDATDVDNMFAKALNLNLAGRSMFRTTNDRTISNNTEGFGTISLSVGVAVAVPEPSTYALMGAGLVGVGMLRRRVMVR